MNRFVRLRLRSRALPIAAGRLSKPHVPAQNRLCSHCLVPVVGDEENFVFECAFLQPLRLKYHPLFTSPSTSMQCFISQKERMSVFKVILECLGIISI